MASGRISFEELWVFVKAPAGAISCEYLKIEQIRHDDEIVLARVRTSTLEILIKDIQIRHRSDMKSLLDKIPLEAQATTMENDDNTNRNTRQGGTPVARKCSYTEFMSCQPFNFKGTEGAVGLIHWFEGIKSVFLRSNYTEDCKVKFYTGTLTEEALSWWNSFAQPIGIRNDLKTYVRLFQELAVLCPTMVPNFQKLMEVFIEGLPRSIEGNVSALKPQTLEEAITITQRLMDQVTKHNFVQGTNDHKRKFDDRRTFTNNNTTRITVTTITTATMITNNNKIEGKKLTRP
ncbi:hypothetical protein Tco_0459663 [Tanacetum coccineum]